MSSGLFKMLPRNYSFTNHTHTHTHTHTDTHTHTHIYIYIYMCVCVCVCAYKKDLALDNQQGLRVYRP